MSALWTVTILVIGCAFAVALPAVTITADAQNQFLYHVAFDQPVFDLRPQQFVISYSGGVVDVSGAVVTGSGTTYTLDVSKISFPGNGEQVLCSAGSDLQLKFAVLLDHYTVGFVNAPDSVCQVPFGAADTSQPSFVIGDGTPSNCTESTLNAVLNAVRALRSRGFCSFARRARSCGQAFKPGGSIVFNCGPQPLSIAITNGARAFRAFAYCAAVLAQACR